MVRQPLLWLPVENLSWFSVFTTYCKMVSVSRSIFIGDSLYQKILILVQLCWRYLKISQVSGFFRHSVYLIMCPLLPSSPITYKYHVTKAHKRANAIHRYFISKDVNIPPYEHLSFMFSLQQIYQNTVVRNGHHTSSLTLRALKVSKEVHKASPNPILPYIALLLSFGRRAFSSAAPQIWNHILTAIKVLPSLDSFKRHLKIHYLTSP